MQDTHLHTIAKAFTPKIARQSKEQDGEYVLTLKANQGTMYQDVVDLFADAETTGTASMEHDTYHSVD